MQVARRCLDAADHARAATVGDRRGTDAGAPLEEGDDVGLAARPRHHVGRIAEVAAQATQHITERAPVGVGRALARAGGAERRERRRRLAARGGQGELLGIRWRDRLARREAVACLQGLRDPVLLLPGGTGVCPAPPPDAALPSRRLVRHGWALASVARARAAATPAATAPAGALTGLGDGELAAVELVAVQLLDGAVGLLGRAHLDEPEAARLAGRAIGDDRGGLAGADAREQLGQLLAGGGEGQVPHEELLAHRSLLLGVSWIGPSGAVEHAWPESGPCLRSRASAGTLSEAALLRPEAAPAPAVLAERGEVRHLRRREVATRELGGPECRGRPARSRRPGS